MQDMCVSHKCIMLKQRVYMYSPLPEGLHNVAVHMQHCLARLSKLAASRQQGTALWPIQPTVPMYFRAQNRLQHQHSILYSPAFASALWACTAGSTCSQWLKGRSRNGMAGWDHMGSTVDHMPHFWWQCTVIHGHSDRVCELQQQQTHQWPHQRS